MTQHGNEGGQASGLVKLLQQVIPLSSEEPEEIMRLFVRLGEVYDLGLVNDTLCHTCATPCLWESIEIFG